MGIEAALSQYLEECAAVSTLVLDGVLGGKNLEQRYKHQDRQGRKKMLGTYHIFFCSRTRDGFNVFSTRVVHTNRGWPEVGER